MIFTDMHAHLLCGVDDGARDEATMLAMLDASYRDGVRRLCATPHFQPDFYGDNAAAREEAFARLSAYAKEHYPDLVLSLGNEVGYRTECLEDLRQGRCLMLGGRYVLLDFPADVSLFIMENAFSRFFSGGYRVILAHVERYGALLGKYRLLREWQDYGVAFQMTASYITLPLPVFERKHRKKAAFFGAYRYGRLRRARPGGAPYGAVRGIWGLIPYIRASRCRQATLSYSQSGTKRRKHLIRPTK